MLADGIKLTSSTGGASTLTCSAQTGWASVAKAFTGTRYIQYSIAEYTTSGKVTLVNLETGVGSYDTNTDVLTRTKVLSTWNGTTYLPNPGSATAPSAISFGTTSANIDIIISPISMNGAFGFPFRPSAAANISDGLGQCGLNISSISSSATLTTGQVHYSPVLLLTEGQVSIASIRQTVALTGGTPTIDIALYEMTSGALPGKRLISFTQIASVGTAATYSSSAIATPQPIIPGWYWQGILYTANSATGNPAVRAGQGLAGTPQGGLLANNPVNGNMLTVTGSLTDPATAPTGNANNGLIPAIYYK